MEEELDELGVIGKTVGGRYHLTRFIGGGAMGAVYEARQDAVDRRVAIKLLNASLQSRPEVRDRFRVEAQAIATLNHPNCVTLFDFGYSDEIAAHYMAVEYLDGRSLDRLITKGLTTSTALTLAKQIADVLVVAHEAGVLHRDLKPENVMVITDREGLPQAKVLDFGLARIFADTNRDTRLTRQGQLFGTPAYMSPEQCRSAMDVGPPADVYALGIALFEMLTGKLPFDAPSVPELLVAHATQTAPPVPVTLDVPIAISGLVARMMSKHPDDRPTAVEVSDILAAVLDGREPPSLPPITREEEAVVSTPTLEPEPAEVETNASIYVPPAARSLVGVGAIIVAVVTGIVAWAVFTARPESPTRVGGASAEPPPVQVIEIPTRERATTNQADLAPFAAELAESQSSNLASSVTSIASQVAAKHQTRERVERRVVSEPVATADPIEPQRVEEAPRTKPKPRSTKPPKLRTLGGAKHLYE